MKHGQKTEAELALEKAISEIVMEDNGSKVEFKYWEAGKFLSTVTAYTINIAGEKFILKEEAGDRPTVALTRILSYIQQSKKEMNSYTVSWKRKGDADEQLSYFYCENPLEVCQKFYAEKKPEDYVVYSIQQNPIS